jgi:hypothetical protein
MTEKAKSASSAYPMSANPQLRRLSERDLDALIADLKQRRATELILLGPATDVPSVLEQWPEAWRSIPVVYQLSEVIPDLAIRLASLTDLRLLDLSYNVIKDSGAASLAKLINITHLNLAGNALSSAGAASLAVLPDITSLSLERNWIGDSGACSLAALTKITSLNLADTWITDKGAACLARLTNLSSLNLRATSISDSGASSLAALINLKHLNLSSTYIQNSGVSALAVLTQLTSLEIADTNVKDLSPLRRLLETGIPVSIQNHEFSSGSCLNVYGCPLINPPLDIIQKGTKAIQNYFNEIEQQGIDRLHEAKVLILGEGGAGKTSLLRRLYRADLSLPDEQESTKGIDIHHHEFINNNGKPFRLNVWDFSGQQIYHSTHQFFLTKRSLYILVDDTRNDSTTIHDKGFKYWLEAIEALSNNCPVVIFQNEKAGRSKTIDEQGIKGRFSSVKDVYRGNLQQADAANCLEEAIRFFVQALPHVGDEVPAQWVKIRSHLDRLKQDNPCISLKIYFDVYEHYLPRDHSKALILSQYFHDLGAFLHFQDDAVLCRTVILQNEWATEAVFKVLDDEPTKSRSGYFTRSDCQRIWAESTYADMHLELLALMEKFELCYKLPDKHSDTWLSPQLLPPSTPEGLKCWPKPDDLVLTYQYDFLPKGIISRLMVRMNRFVREPNRSWGSGAFFEQGVNQLLACISSSHGQEIILRARGPERKALMSVISSDMDALNASFEGLRDKVRKLVPCICIHCQQSDDPTRFTEEELLERKAIEKTTIECRRHPYLNVSVVQLLDGLRLSPDHEIKGLDRHESGSTTVLGDAPSFPRIGLTVNLSTATAMNNTTVNASDGNLINTGSLNIAGGMVNLGALSDQARITIEALPERRLVDGQPSLRELLQELKASVDVDPQLPDNTRAEALTEVTELANAAQDPQKNVGPARRAINALKGLSAGLSETNKAVAETSKLVGAVKTVLPLIAGFFVG